MINYTSNRTMHPGFISNSFILIIFSIATVTAISIVNFYTRPIITKHVAERLQVIENNNNKLFLVKKVIPDAETIEKLGEWTKNEKSTPYYLVKNGNQKIGYAILSYGKGYQSLIETLIGLDKNFKITGITILSQAETPGLGEGVLSEEFQKQFSGRDISTLNVSTTEEEDGIQALTAATISTRAVVDDAVKNAVFFLQKTITAN
jgi:electron transport complex protein RnfG